MPEPMRPNSPPMPASVSPTVFTGLTMSWPVYLSGLRPASASARENDCEVLTFSSSDSATSSLLRMRNMASPRTETWPYGVFRT